MSPRIADGRSCAAGTRAVDFVPEAIRDVLKPRSAPSPTDRGKSGSRLRIFLPAAMVAVNVASVAVGDDGNLFQDDERLEYKIAWPSGLSVGTAEIRSRNTDPGWRFEMTLQASLPGFDVDDAFLSRTDPMLCSAEFDKHLRHGKKQAHERLRFGDGTLERRNLFAGGQGLAPARPCERDALAFLQFARRELAAGRVPAPAKIYFGAGYGIRMKYARTRWLPWGPERREADEIRVEVRGPASEHDFSVYFGRDPARTPLLIQVKIEGKAFAMRLAE